MSTRRNEPPADEGVSSLLEPLHLRYEFGKSAWVRLTVQEKSKIRHAVSVVSGERGSHAQSVACQAARRLRSRLPRHRAPRWTFPFLYFRGQAGSILRGTRGLDVGGRTRKPDRATHSLMPSESRAASELSERFVPHWLYYRALGVRMYAVDVNARKADAGVLPQDARALAFRSGVFDFITAAMILGASNVCASPLEIALCLSEFRRVLLPGGLVYLADTMVQPEVIYAAQLLEYEVACSKGLTDGLPVGTFLRQRGDECGRFDAVFNASTVVMLASSVDAVDEIRFADLFVDPSIPEVVSAPPADRRKAIENAYHGRPLGSRDPSPTRHQREPLIQADHTGFDAAHSQAERSRRSFATPIWPVAR